MQANMAHEIESEETANTLAQKRGIGVDGIRIKYSALFAEGHPLFVAKFDRHAPLSPEQIEVLSPVKKGAKKSNTPKASMTAQGAGKSAPALLEGKVWQVVSLSIAFALPTLASAFNTYKVSHYLATDWRVSIFVMGMVTLTPILFIAARMNWMGVVAAFGVVVFEGFCNLSTIYLALMGKMEYVLGGIRGECSPFLQSVVNVTNSEYRPTAIWVALSLSVIIATVQLIAFWGIRNRIK